LSTIFKNNYLAKKLKTISELADFQQYIIENQVNFGKSSLFLRREKLWKVMIENVSTDKDIVIIELGVAWGYTTNWFVEKGFSLLNKNHEDVEIQMESFDLFTGLPLEWRNHPQGFFSNNGVAPDIVDHRVKFHIGLVEETIRELDLRKLTESRLVVLFDLDLFNPTLSVYNHIKNSVTVGDIFYFDEAFDDDERAIIRDHLMKDFEIELIGITSLAFAAKIVRIRTNAL